MKTLALRIYLAVVTVLLLFALLTGWLAKRNLEREIQRFQSEQVFQNVIDKQAFDAVGRWHGRFQR